MIISRIKGADVHGVRQTIERGVCIGCGACAYATDGQIPITLNADGMYVAKGGEGSSDAYALADPVCPFSDAAFNEDQLSELVHDAQLEKHEFLGVYSKTFVGRVRSLDYLDGSSSGGLTSWLLEQLLVRGVIDTVLNVGRPESAPPLFSYGAVNGTEAGRRRKSQYYSTTLEDVLPIVRDVPGKYALVGVPCFIKAARLLAEQDPVLKERIVFHVGLVCGHMKSQFFAESLAWQVGVEPRDLEAVDFRVKRPGRASSDYDFGARSAVDGKWIFERTGALVGGNWGHGAFQPEACNFCDDIFAETADVAFGDAWLPEYRSDWRGTNVVVSRSALVNEILETGGASGELELVETTPDRVAESQAGNFRHRRLGVSVRAADDLARGLSVPRKRVPASTEGIDKRRLKIIRERRKLSTLSFRAFRDAKEADDLEIYLTAMKAAAARYQRLYSPLWRRVGSRAKGLLKRVLRRASRRG